MNTRQALKTQIVPTWLMDEMVNGGQQKSNISNEQDSYNKVPIIYRAVRLRCNALSRIPVYMYQGDSEEPMEEEEYPYPELPLNKHLWLAEAALLLKGASYTLVGKNTFGTDSGELFFLDPFTVNAVVKNSELSFEQQVESKRRIYSKDEILYWQEYDPTNSQSAGVSAGGVSLGSAQLRHYLGRFSSTFFEKGAMPVTMLSLPVGTQTPERERVEDFFKRAIHGIKNAFRVVAVSGEVKPTILTPSMNTLAVPELGAYTREDIAYAFDIPETVLSSKAASYATASSDYRSFLEQTIVPRCYYFEEQFNKYLKEQGYRVEFAPDEMTEMQEDESARASAFKTYVDAGMTPELAAEILGVDIPESFTGEKWKKEQAPPPPMIVQPKDEPKEKPKDEDMADEDMKKWEKKAIHRLKEGKSAQVSFESDRLPESIKTLAYNALALAKSESDIKAIFNG
jgi:HK97 family phage portal protein